MKNTKTKNKVYFIILGFSEFSESLSREEFQFQKKLKTYLVSQCNTDMVCEIRKEAESLLILSKLLVY